MKLTGMRIYGSEVQCVSKASIKRVKSLYSVSIFLAERLIHTLPCRSRFSSSEVVLVAFVSPMACSKRGSKSECSNAKHQPIPLKKAILFI